MSRCKGKNCKHTRGFDVPHSAECQEAHDAASTPDNSCGPNNIKVLNPGHEDVMALGSAEYMKLLVLAMHVLDVEEVLITSNDIDECTDGNAVICIANTEEGICLKLVSREEADEIAAEQGGGTH